MPSIGDFHVPNGPEVGYLPKIVPNKDVSVQLISPFFIEDEFYSWDGPYLSLIHISEPTRPY